MSAETIVYVVVEKSYREIVEISALTMEDAVGKASALPNVNSVLDWSYHREDLSE